MSPRIAYDVTGVSVISPEPGSTVRRDLPDPAKLESWQSALLANNGAMQVLRDRYGLKRATVVEFELGLDGRRSGPWITFPVRDGNGKLINVRSRYVGGSAKLNETGRKYTNWTGHGSPALYPAHKLPPAGNRLLVCCGEFDALAANQLGIPTVTTTGGVTAPWPGEWDDLAEHYQVTVLFDRGEEVYADRLARHLRCRAAHLPADLPAGTDIADVFTNHGWTARRLLRLLLDLPGQLGHEQG